MIAVIEQYQSTKKPQLRAIRRNGFIGGALALAGDCEPIATPTSAWDRDGQDCLLNVLNGTLDLQSGILRPHDRGDLFTAVTDVEFTDPEPDAVQVWDAFVTRLFPDPKERELVQTFAGYCLSGLTMDHHFLMLIGEPNSGKSTFLNALVGVLGSHAVQFSPRTILAGPHGHETELMAFRGRRLAWCAELPRNAAIDTAIVNGLTGDATITGRYMRQDFVTYRRTSKMLLAGNHRPRFGDTCGDGLTRRLMMIEAREIPEDQREQMLGERLATPAVKAAILSWAVKGFRMFVANGNRLVLPKSVQDRNAEAFAEDDSLSDFLAECVEDAPGAVIAVQDLYLRYSSWCEANGQRRVKTKTGLTRALRKRGWEKPKSGRPTAGASAGKSVQCHHGHALKGDAKAAQDFQDQAAQFGGFDDNQGRIPF